MHTTISRAVLVSTLVATGVLTAAGTANAVPDKEFPVQVTCAGLPVQYVSPMLGADAIWLVDGAGQLQRFALLYADDYLGDTLLAQHSYGVKAGYGVPIVCSHRADWPFGTVTGTLLLAPAPSN